MAMDATCQIRMDGELKTQVEALYRDLGTSFAEAVRIFAQQSVREGRMPFRPSLKTWDELTAEEILIAVNERLRQAFEQLMAEQKSEATATGGDCFCQYCGKPLVEGDSFCRHCGKKIE